MIDLACLRYCTGDAHLGTQTKHFNGSEKIHFWGRKNFMYALRWYEEQISQGNAVQPTKVLTSGCSAGSVGSYINILISKKIFPVAKHYHWVNPPYIVAGNLSNFFRRTYYI